jgi:hypothetical protein
MMKVQEIQEWLENLEPTSTVAVDDGGLILVEIDSDGNETGELLEVGGIPLER